MEAGNTVIVIEHNLDVIKTCRLDPRPGPRGRRRRAAASSPPAPPSKWPETRPASPASTLKPYLKR